jgi:acyl carrier protein
VKSVVVLAEYRKSLLSCRETQALFKDETYIMCATATEKPEPGDVRQFVLELVREKAGMEPQPQQPLGFSGIDSVTLAEVSYEIEQRYKVTIGEEAFELETLNELIEYVAELNSCE